MILWTHAYVSPKTHRPKKLALLTSFVVTELSLSNMAVLDGVTFATQQFMRSGMSEDLALVSGYTLLISQGRYRH